MDEFQGETRNLKDLAKNFSDYGKKENWSLENKRAYNKKGSAYDLVRPLGLYKYLAKYFKRTLSNYLKEDSYILDAGCGTGNSTYFLDNCFKKCRIKGIDQAQNMLKVAKSKKFRNDVSFEHASIEYFDSDSRFDAVQFFQVVHHFRDLDVVLSLSERVLKEGGVIFFIDFFSRNPFIKILNSVYCKFLGQGKYYVRDFNKARSVLRKKGYKILRIKTHPLLMNYSLIVARKMY